MYYIFLGFMRKSWGIVPTDRSIRKIRNRKSLYPFIHSFHGFLSPSHIIFRMRTAPVIMCHTVDAQLLYLLQHFLVRHTSADN